MTLMMYLVSTHISIHKMLSISICFLFFIFLDVEIPTDIKLEDDKDDLLEKALHKARKIKQKENLIADIIKTEIKEESDEHLDNGNIVLNATAEFCRTLGKFQSNFISFFTFI